MNPTFSEIASRRSDRLIAFAGIDTRRQNAANLFETVITRLKVKELNIHPAAGFYPNSPECYKLFEIVRAHKVPVLTHRGTIFPLLKAKYAMPVYLDDATVDFPDVIVIAIPYGRCLERGASHSYL